MTTNLPPTTKTDSSDTTKILFNNYGQTRQEFSANDFNFTVSFFESYGFATDAATVVANALLTQAKKGFIYQLSATGDVIVSQGNGPTPIFKILDTLKGVAKSTSNVNVSVIPSMFSQPVRITNNISSATTDYITYTFTLTTENSNFNEDVISVTGGTKGLLVQYNSLVYAMEVKPTATSIELSTLVGGILNSDRQPTSTLGFKQVYNAQYITRNIAA